MKKTIFYTLLLLSAIMLLANANGTNPIKERLHAVSKLHTSTAKARKSEPRAQHLPATDLQSELVNDSDVKLSWEAPTGFGSITALSEDFNAGEVPAGWKNIDSDGDGYSWMFRQSSTSPDGTGLCIRSESWFIGKDGNKETKADLNPDNWLITTKISIPADAKLDYNIGLAHPTSPKETYAIYLSETDNEIASFTTLLLKEKLSEPVRQGEKDERSTAVWFDRTIDLSAYAGKEVYLAFRHFESFAEWAILLDNIKVWHDAGKEDAPSFTYNIYRNDEKIESGINETEFVDQNAPFGELRYDVEVQYADGVSPKTSTEINHPDPSDVAYIYLESHDVWGDGSGYQILLDATATQYGLSIPATGNLTSSCTVPPSLHTAFTHRVPQNAEITCTPEHQVVDGIVMVAIPAGTYDYVVVNPTPGQAIFIANNGRGDDYHFEAHKHYRFLAEKNPNEPSGQDHVVLSVSDTPFAVINPVSNLKAEYNTQDKEVTLTWDKPMSKRNAALDEDFEAGLPSTWTTIDADGDGHNWRQLGAFEGHNGGGCVSSSSYINSIGALTPDNYLVTPELNLAEGGTLSFWVSAQDASWAAEKLAVYAATGNSEADFNENTLIHQETLTNKQRVATEAGERGRVQGSWHERSISVPAGTKYIAFRHYDTKDMFAINLDDVKISSENGETPTEGWTYNVYRESDFLNNVSAETYVDKFSTPGTYKYEVEVKYADGTLSNKVATSVTIPNETPAGTATITLEAHNVWGDGSGYQIFLDNTSLTYGTLIPESGPLTNGCDVPAELLNAFSHSAPEGTTLSCTPELLVVDGSTTISIPAGVYDFCIVNPEPGNKIWIAGGEYGRKDNFLFEADKEYHFQAELQGTGDAITLTVIDGIEEIVSAMKVYGMEGYLVIETDQAADFVVYDLYGRHIAKQQVNGKAMIPAQTGAYLVQVTLAGKSHAQKVLVK